MFVRKNAYTENHDMVALSSANIGEVVNGYVISIHCDDFCGALPKLIQADLQVFVCRDDGLDIPGDNVTNKCFNISDGDAVFGSIENIIKAYEWCKNN